MVILLADLDLSVQMSLVWQATGASSCPLHTSAIGLVCFVSFKLTYMGETMPFQIPFADINSKVAPLCVSLIRLKCLLKYNCQPL